MDELTLAQAHRSHTLIHAWKCQLFSKMLPHICDTLGYMYAITSVLFWLLTLCGWPYTCHNEMISQCMVEAHRTSRTVACSSLLGCASLPAFYTPQLRHPVTSFQTCLSTAYMIARLSLTSQVLHSIRQQIWKTQEWPQDWKRSVFFPNPKAMPKNIQTTTQFHSFHMLAK